ncbi:MAG: ISAs1 family transposase, partial [Bacteroidota bacterium]
MELTEIFEDMPDCRVLGRISHKLSELLIISLCAVLGGVEDYEEIAEYGRQKKEFLRTFLELKHVIPSHDTLTRVFRFLDKEAFSRCWSEEIVSSLDALQINIDGK